MPSPRLITELLDGGADFGKIARLVGSTPKTMRQVNKMNKMKRNRQKKKKKKGTKTLVPDDGGFQIVPDSDKGKPKHAPEQVKAAPNAEITTGNCETETKINMKISNVPPFNLWAQQHRNQMVKENPDVHYNQIAKMMGAQWRALPESEKMAFVEEVKMRGLARGNSSKVPAEFTSQQNESWEETLETEDTLEDDDDDSHFIEAL